MPSAALRLKRASLTRHSSIRACSKACRWDGISGLDKRDPACFAAKKRDTDDSLSVAAQLLCQEVQRVHRRDCSHRPLLPACEPALLCPALSMSTATCGNLPMAVLPTTSEGFERAIAPEAP